MPFPITHHRSPNFDDRPVNTVVDTIIIHYTGMETPEDALERLCDEGEDARARGRVSAHYMIYEDGRIVSLVSEADRAWHAGASFFRGKTNLNNNSIGIELVNCGHYIGYTDFPKVQMDALTELCTGIIQRHPIQKKLVLGHNDIAIGRKNDPGEKFDWACLAKAGIGLWPAPEKKDYDSAQVYMSSPSTLRGALIKYGYDPEAATPLMCMAFNRHYLSNANKDMSLEGAARLAWLNRQS